MTSSFVGICVAICMALALAGKEDEFVFEYKTRCVTRDVNGTCLLTRTSGSIHEPVCFPESARVYTKCEDTICETQMQHLKVGQEILVDFENNKFETVKGWLHRAPTMSAIYIGINVGYKTQLYISSDHLMLINNQFQRSKNAKVGDIVHVGGKHMTINALNKFILRGAYTPWVSGSGAMIVNEFKVHSMSHNTEWAPNICWWIFNKIAKPVDENQVYDDNDDYLHPTVKRLQWVFGIVDYTEDLPPIEDFYFENELNLERERRRSGHSNAGSKNTNRNKNNEYSDDDEEDEDEKKAMFATLIGSFIRSDQQLFFNMHD